MQNYPNQLTPAICNRPDAPVAPQPPPQTMIHNLEDASSPLTAASGAVLMGRPTAPGKGLLSASRLHAGFLIGELRAL